MEESEESPRLTGVVIITLPPRDNPSLGKTITAFTLTNDSPLPQHQESQHHVEPPRPSRPVENQNPQAQRHFWFKRLFLGRPILAFGIISMYMIGLYLWVSFTQGNFFELRDIDDDRESNTIILPLFPKMGVRRSSPGDYEIKLGRYVDSNSKISVETLLSEPVSQRKTAKPLSVESTIDSSTILPITGNIFPDG